MKVVYIAGPITGPNHWEVEQNIRVAEKACLDIFDMGAMFICPHTMGRFLHGRLDYDRVLKADLAVLKRCDAMFIVGDYKKSKGTMGEIEFARKNYIPIFYDIRDLKWWNGLSGQKSVYFTKINIECRQSGYVEYCEDIKLEKPTMRLVRSDNKWDIEHLTELCNGVEKYNNLSEAIYDFLELIFSKGKEDEVQKG